MASASETVGSCTGEISIMNLASSSMRKEDSQSNRYVLKHVNVLTVSMEKGKNITVNNVLLPFLNGVTHSVHLLSLNISYISIYHRVRLPNLVKSLTMVLVMRWIPFCTNNTPFNLHECMRISLNLFLPIPNNQYQSTEQYN